MENYLVLTELFYTPALPHFGAVEPFNKLVPGPSTCPLVLELA